MSSRGAAETTVPESAMAERFTKPFTKAEMEAMRRALDAEPGVRRDFWAKLKRLGRRIPFAEDLLAAYFCTLDPATPNRVRLILLGAIAYFVLPVDGVPDFLPLLGFADDAALLMAAITQVAGSIAESHREQARAALQEDGALTA
jgi:uncharacterized membrane protein YkvA (DUF1232 family)